MSEGSGGPLQVWSADLQALSFALERVEASLGLLSSSERAWPVEPPPETRRWRRLARIALRVALMRAGAHDARGTALTLDVNGKPSLASGSPAFSVAHSEHLALFAIASAGPLGIDLECERQVALSARRQELIEAAACVLCGAAKPIGFLQAWTSLEALAKARGTGVGPLLTDLGVTASGTRTLSQAEVASNAARVVAACGLAVVQIAMPPGIYASAAGPPGIVNATHSVRHMTEADCSLGM